MHYLQFFVLNLFVIVSLHAQAVDTIFDLYDSQYLTIDGYKINIEVKGDGPAIVFIPGGPGNSHDYMQGNFGHYYTSHKCIFIDLLGRGKSDDANSPSEYSVSHDAYIIDQVRQVLGLEKISVVGHSYGTVVAQAYAVQYTEFTDKMFLIAGFHSGEMWQANCDSYNHYAKTHFPEKWAKVDSLRALGYISSDPEFSSVYGSFPVKYIYYHDTSLKQNVPNTKYRGFNVDVYYSIIGRDADFFVSGSMMDTDFRKDLAKLDIPTVITAGRYDGVSTPEYNIQYKIYMPQAQFVMFEKSAHNPYLEEPKKFYRLFDEFFEVPSLRQVRSNSE